MTTYILSYCYCSHHHPLVYTGILQFKFSDTPTADTWAEAKDNATPVKDYLVATGSHGYYQSLSVLSHCTEAN